MELSRRERVLRALTYQEVDRLPTQVNYTGSMGRSMAQHFGVDVADLPARLDNHLVRLDLSYDPRMSDDGRARFDWWGAGHDTQEEGYFIRVSPLAEDSSARISAEVPQRSDPPASSEPMSWERPAAAAIRLAFCRSAKGAKRTICLRWNKSLTGSWCACWI